jgi:hypothetical protein
MGILKRQLITEKKRTKGGSAKGDREAKKE